MIIVEGLDNTGKTTLVSRLMDEFPGLQYKSSIGNKHDPVSIRNQAEAEAYQYGPNVISDRSRIISEYVYQPQLKVRDTAYPPKDWLRFLGEWSSRSQCLVYCYRDLDQIRFDFEESAQLPGVYDHLEALNERYDRVMALIRDLFEITRGHEYVEYNFQMTGGNFDAFEPVKESVSRYLSLYGEYAGR